MKRLWLVVAALWLNPGLADAGDLPPEISLSVGESRLLQVDLKRAALGNGRIVSLATPEKGQLLVLGETAGSTTAQLWMRDGSSRSLRITVSSQGIEELLQQVQALLPAGTGMTAHIAGGHVLLQADRATAEDLQRASEIASLFPGRVLNFLGREAWESMVQMEVRMVEVRRDQLRQLGLDWSSQVQGPGAALSAGAGDGIDLGVSISSVLDSRIDVLQQKGMAFVVAEPSLSCRSGGVARFVSGGEVPIPVTDGLGATDVQYKEYGVILEIRPRAGMGDDVYAEVEVELSQLDASVRVGDFPGFVKRRTSTAINVRSGETIALSGLLFRERSRNRQGLPVLSAVPAAGWLFGTQRRQSRQSELVVLITPRVLSAGDQSRLIERAGTIAAELAP